MSGGPRIDPGRNASDFLLIIAILGLCLFAVRHNFTKNDSSVPPEQLRAPGTQGMDNLWRDAVKPSKDYKDMRPQADPRMIWDEPRPAWQEVAQPEEPAQPEARQPEPEDEDYAVPTLPEQTETAAPMPKLEPMEDSFFTPKGQTSSSAFLKAPPIAGAGPEARERTYPEAPRQAAASSSRKGASSASDRHWRRPNAR